MVTNFLHLDVVNGSSIQGKTAKDLANRTTFLTPRSCAVEIRNHHRNLELVGPQYYAFSGSNIIPPSSIIAPGFAEMFLFRKSSGSLWGTSGVLVYDIRRVNNDGSTEYDNSQFVFMWSVQTIGKNCYALGISQCKELDANLELYNTLRYDRKCWFWRGFAGVGVTLENQELYGIPVNVYGSFSQSGRAVCSINIK